MYKRSNGWKQARQELEFLDVDYQHQLEYIHPTPLTNFISPPYPLIHLLQHFDVHLIRQVNTILNLLLASHCVLSSLNCSIRQLLQRKVHAVAHVVRYKHSTQLVLSTQSYACPVPPHRQHQLTTAAVKMAMIDNATATAAAEYSSFELNLMVKHLIDRRLTHNDYSAKKRSLLQELLIEVCTDVSMAAYSTAEEMEHMIAEVDDEIKHMDLQEIHGLVQ